MPILITYFCYGASAITAIALLFFQKEALAITPAEAAAIAFWVALPWSTKMVAGVASDAYPIFGSHRKAYLLLGALASLVGYALLATVVSTRSGYLAAMVLVTVGFMVQDVVADALSVEVARSDEEIAQVQALGRMALLAGGISVGYLSGWLAGRHRPTRRLCGGHHPPAAGRGRGAPRAAAAIHARRRRPEVRSGGTRRAWSSSSGSVCRARRRPRGVGLPFAQEIVLVVSGGLIVMLLGRVGISRAVAVAAFAIFLFRACRAWGRGIATGRSIGSDSTSSSSASSRRSAPC